MHIPFTIWVIKQLKEKPCNKILVLALDNDKAGKRAMGRFIEELAETDLDIPFTIWVIWNRDKILFQIVS